jgi:hypothetical protein
MFCLVCVSQISGFSLGGIKYTTLIQFFKHGLIFFKNHSGFQRNDPAKDLTFSKKLFENPAGFAINQLHASLRKPDKELHGGTQ